MAVFSITCMVLYRLSARFAQAVDDATMEVADYSVVVKGLPETTPVDVSDELCQGGSSSARLRGLSVRWGAASLAPAP